MRVVEGSPLRTITRRMRAQASDALWSWRCRRLRLHIDPRLPMEDLVRSLVTPGGANSFEQIRQIVDACHARDRRSLHRSGSTRLEDAVFLYLLVRKIRPRTIFEVGTLIGTSASAMAHAQAEIGEGGELFTVDGSYGDFQPLEGHAIRCFPGRRSDAALETLGAEKRRIDFLFVDGTIGRRDVELLNELGAPDLVIALHDFKPPYDKGLVNAWYVARYFDGAASSVWILPERQGTGYPATDGLLVNSSVAVLLPERLAREIVAPPG